MNSPYFSRSWVFVLVWATEAVTTVYFAHASRGELNQPPRLDRSSDTSFDLGGPLRVQIDAVVQNWLLQAPDRNPAMLGMFADRDRTPYRNLLPWSGEFAGKYLTACTQVLRLTHDERLKKYLQRFVDRLVALQDRDGYLGPFPKEFRLTGKAPNCPATWDAWGHYHIMIGLLLWHEQTHDPQALACAERIGDLLCDRFLGHGRRVFDMGSPDQNQAVVHSLARLYEVTGVRRYLNLSEQIVGEFETPGAGDYLRTALAGKEFYATPKPRWESLHAIIGLAELDRITGKEDYRKAFEHIWWSIVKLDRHNNGGFSSGEQAVGDPYNPAPIETCSTIAWIATSVEMLRTTGNSIAADELELSTLNSVVGLHSPDGKWSTYNTPMDGRRVPNTVDIAFQIRPGSEQLNCCSVNAARGFGMISDWALMRESIPSGAGGAAPLVLNWYGPSVLTTKVGDVVVVLKQATTYPRDGHIELQVAPKSAVAFPLKLRIPSWSAVTRVSVNGTETVARAGAYCTLAREWKAGDRVSIDLDMSLRAWVGERECAGKVALYRGPLLLAWECQPISGAIAAGGDDERRQVAVAPALDLKTLSATLISAEQHVSPALVLLDAGDAAGRPIRLRDFGTAGRDRIAYACWFPAKAGPPVPFTPANPLRTIPVKAGRDFSKSGPGPE
jgi:uncharacterized protein